MTRDRLLAALLALAAAALAYWLFTRTEWVDIEIPTPPRGEAARDEWYAAAAVLRGLGVPVQRQTHLDTLPPLPATLWLESLHWDLFPERRERLRRWVEQGGHLVVNSHQLEAGGPLAQWVPVQARYPSRDDSDDETDDDGDMDEAEAAADEDAPSATVPPPPQAASGPVRVVARGVAGPCLDLRERPGLQAAYGDRQPMRVCSVSTGIRLTSQAAPLWALQGPRSAYALRVPLGAGRVTVTAPLPARNHQVLHEDNAAALVATLAAQPGQPLWLVTDEARPPLLATLWDRGAPALLLGGLALALALWRGGSRFGPPAAVPPAARRSVAEQVRGTARFVWKHSPAVLLAAQQRATAQAAERHIARYAHLAPAARAAALARLTGLSEAALAQALGPMPPGAAAHAQALSLLESARRRLEAAPAPARGHPSTPHS
jgi:hypothetical protein